MNLAGKFYAELSYTLDPSTIDFNKDLSAEGVTIFKDDGGIGVAVAVECSELGLALHLANVKARRHIGFTEQPWKVTVIDSERMEKHFLKAHAEPLPLVMAA